METTNNMSPNADAVPEELNGNPSLDVDNLAEKFKGFAFLNESVESTDSTVISYPFEVEQRLKALKKLQMDVFKTECKFFEELHDLETKYTLMQKENFEKRSKITAGKYQPTEEECKLDLLDIEEDINDAESKEKNANSDSPVAGIPRFWLTIFQNIGQFSDIIEDHDIPILEHLEDVTLELTNSPMGFVLSFHFSPNEYFSNPVLTKTYEMRIRIDPKEPFSFEGTEIYKSTGCQIDWKEGKDVTVREVKKKQKHKSTGIVRMTSKMVENPSFFEIFNPTQIDEDDDNVDTDVQVKVTTDFEMGSFLKERVIPRAVLYFTGEALESDDEDDDDFSDEESGEEEEEDEAGNEMAKESGSDNEDD